MRLLSAAIAATLLLTTVASAQTIDKIKDTGELVIGFRTDASPLSVLGDNGPQGYSVELCARLAQKIADSLALETMDVVFEPVTTENRFEKVANGEIDLLCGAATITLSRRALVDFSTPTYVDGTTVALKNGGPGSFEELAGKKIGVRSATTTLEALNTTLGSMNMDAEVVEFDDHAAGMAALESDAISAYFADQSILMQMVQSGGNADAYNVFENLLTVEKHGLAMRRGDSDFRLLVDTGLSTLFAEGGVSDAFGNNIGATPGFALEAMYLLSPTLP
ncbi:amino acid ABC transporter substrate-binding protein [Tateyamaria sp. Alg231-49]|uniref:amino acid ABC transporter substrate-binding protein n=1 Tax=Tateyamaria sp. Alg231-49 TaxID=1922219 RepID=UPI000D553A83|nr:amino acid ABC transporter substrate-binding protein [Tateyamaria sp. Alg231-49]